MSNVPVFKRAERKKSFLKIAFTGPSGYGKTLSALLIAKGIGKRIAAIDTENGSMSLYSDRADFDVIEMNAPYRTEKYMDAIDAAIDAGYDTLVIDSMTHAWAGEGGLLEQKERLDAAGGNSFTNWAKITPKHNAFIAKIVQAKINIIVTIRSKSDVVLVENSKGKMEPRKVGLAPIQRDGVEFEFTTVFDMTADHHATASKDRTGLFDGLSIVPSEKTGQEFVEWLNKVPDQTPPEPSKMKPAPVVEPSAKQAQAAASSTPSRPSKPTLAQELADPGNTIFGGGMYHKRTFKDVADDPKVGWVELQRYMQALSDWSPRSSWMAHVIAAFPAFKAQVETNHAEASAEIERTADSWQQDDFDKAYAGSK